MAKFDNYAAINIRKLRTNKGMSRQEMTEKLSDLGIQMHVNSLRRIEEGNQPIKLFEAIAFAEMFQMGLEQLVSSPLDPIEANVTKHFLELEYKIVELMHKYAELQVSFGGAEIFWKSSDIPPAEQSKAVDELQTILGLVKHALELGKPMYDFVDKYMVEDGDNGSR